MPGSARTPLSLSSSGGLQPDEGSLHFFRFPSARTFAINHQSQITQSPIDLIPTQANPGLGWGTHICVCSSSVGWGTRPGSARTLFLRHPEEGFSPTKDLLLPRLRTQERASLYQGTTSVVPHSSPPLFFMLYRVMTTGGKPGTDGTFPGGSPPIAASAAEALGLTPSRTLVPSLPGLDALFFLLSQDCARRYATACPGLNSSRPLRGRVCSIEPS